MTSPEQSRQALQHANATRFARVEIRRAVREGRTSIADALRHPAVQNLFVIDVLAYQARWGVTRSHKAILGICTPNRLVSDLTNRQHQLLADVVDGRLVYDPGTGEHIAPKEAAERRAVLRLLTEEDTREEEAA